MQLIDAPSARYIGAMMHAQHQFNKVDCSMNEALRFDEIWHTCDTELKKINDDLERFVR